MKSILWVLVIIWCIVILSFSSEPAKDSKAKSGKILKTIEPAVKKVEGTFELDIINNKKLHKYIRKSAHILNYSILGGLLFLAFKQSNFSKNLWVVYISGTAFSCIDEYFQTFIPGRSGELGDIFIDNIGVILGIFIAWKD